jgi:hypothetical protein
MNGLEIRFFVASVEKKQVYIKSIQKVLTGELEYAKFNKDSTFYRR